MHILVARRQGILARLYDSIEANILTKKLLESMVSILVNRLASYLTGMYDY